MNDESLIVVYNAFVTDFRHVEQVLDLLFVLNFPSEGLTKSVDQKDQVLDINPPGCILVIV